MYVRIGQRPVAIYTIMLCTMCIRTYSCRRLQLGGCAAEARAQRTKQIEQLCCLYGSPAILLLVTGTAAYWGSRWASLTSVRQARACNGVQAIILAINLITLSLIPLQDWVRHLTNICMHAAACTWRHAGLP